MRPVHLTVSPSEMCSYSPRITAPTESRSRFSARPNDGVPSAWPGTPAFRPASRPTGRACADAVGHGDHGALVADVRRETPRPSMRLLISSEISAGLSCMTLSFFLSRGWRHQAASATFICSRRALTEVSSTSSPTTTRMPPISDGSCSTVTLQLAAEALFQRGDQLGQRGGVDREGAVAPPRRTSRSARWPARGTAWRFPAARRSGRFRAPRVRKLFAAARQRRCRRRRRSRRAPARA